MLLHYLISQKCNNIHFISWCRPAPTNNQSFLHRSNDQYKPFDILTFIIISLHILHKFILFVYYSINAFICTRIIIPVFPPPKVLSETKVFLSSICVGFFITMINFALQPGLTVSLYLQMLLCFFILLKYSLVTGHVLIIRYSPISYRSIAFCLGGDSTQTASWTRVCVSEINQCKVSDPMFHKSLKLQNMCKG